MLYMWYNPLILLIYCVWIIVFSYIPAEFLRFSVDFCESLCGSFDFCDFKPVFSGFPGGFLVSFSKFRSKFS